MKIIILSDTHGSKKNMDKLVPFIKEKIDLIIHAGDNFKDSIYLKDKTGVSVLSVVGNCDFDNAEDELDFDINGVKFFLTHGHRYGVKYSRETLALEAKKRNADIAIYGHTHIKEDSFLCGIRTINPGSLSQPRDSFSGSYVIMDIEGENLTYEFKSL